MNRKEKVLWVLFCATCLQVTFRVPYIMLVRGINVFSGLLCAVTFVWAVIAWREPGGKLTPTHLVSLALAVLAVLSGLHSEYASTASLRVFVLLGSGLGGFWCGRMMLGSRPAQAFFKWLCLVMLTGLLAVGVASYFLRGATPVLLNLHKHPFNGLILLFSAAPVSLLLDPGKRAKVVGVLYLLASYLVIALSFDPLIWFPPLLCLFVVLVRGRRTALHAVVATVIVVAFAVVFHVYYVPDRFGQKDDISTYSRVENYPFSLHMALKHPLLGIGLCTPRAAYLDDYTIKYPYVTREQFRSILPENRSSENQFLTLMCDLGFPFLILYSGGVLVLVVRLMRAVRAGGGPDPRPGLHPVALLVPVAGALLHFQFWDGLLHPEACWFFHLLLGMIPAPAEGVGESGAAPEC